MVSALSAFNAFVPKDLGARRAARAVPFGEHARQAMDVYVPRRRPAGALPIIVFFYGGNWAAGMRQGYGFAGRALASRGFVAVLPDYRLVPQFRFPAFLEDGAAAVARARKIAPAYGGDADRVILVGHSAGAYIAAMLALDPQWLGPDRAAVRGLAGLGGPYDFLPLDTVPTRVAFGKAEDLEATQPVNFASADAPPALLLHGAEDTTVHPRHSRTLAERLAQAGAEAELRLYPRVGHVGLVTALALPFRRRAPVLADIAAFAARVSA
ncbi:MAG TPA: alpha/beta hydrolase [Allosphingosinicella sp.]|jgi:acetyl esterase/lipase